MKKYTFAASKIAVLGSIVSEAYVHPDSGKLSALIDLHASLDVLSIRQYMIMF